MLLFSVLPQQKRRAGFTLNGLLEDRETKTVILDVLVKLQRLGHYPAGHRPINNITTCAKREHSIAGSIGRCMAP
jgi:hypothetical protein